MLLPAPRPRPRGGGALGPHTAHLAPAAAVSAVTVSNIFHAVHRSSLQGSGALAIETWSGANAPPGPGRLAFCTRPPGLRVSRPRRSRPAEEGGGEARPGLSHGARRPRPVGRSAGASRARPCPALQPGPLRPVRRASERTSRLARHRAGFGAVGASPRLPAVADRRPPSAWCGRHPLKGASVPPEFWQPRGKPFLLVLTNFYVTWVNY